MKKTLLALLFIALSLPGYLFAENQKIKVGVIAPLSGPIAEYGTAAKNGIEIAVSENPEDFKKIEFIYEDSQWKAYPAVNAFNKLTSKDKVDIIYNWGNPTSEAIAPLAERKKLPLLAMSLDPSVAIGKQYVVRTTGPSSDFSDKLGEYLIQKDYKKIGVVIAENTYVRGLYDGLKKALRSNRRIEIIDNYNNSDNDFRSTVTKIRSGKYDAVGVFLLTGQVSEFYRQLKEQDVNTPTFGTDFFESTTEIKMARGGMEGSVYPHLGVEPEFRDKYIEKYGNDLQLAYAGNGHDVALVIASLFKSGKQSPDVIMQSLKQTKNFEGVGGSFDFVNTAEGGPYLSFPIYIKEIRNSQPQVLE